MKIGVAKNKKKIFVQALKKKIQLSAKTLGDKAKDWLL